MSYVYVNVNVYHQNGAQLMPANPAKAGVLVKTAPTKGVTRKPFTIQPLFETTRHVQELNPGARVRRE
jgi:hypothetical protein